MGLFISKLGLFLSKLIMWKKDDGEMRKSEPIPKDLDPGSYTNNRVMDQHWSEQNQDADGTRYDTEQMSENSMTNEETDHSSADRRSNLRSELDDDKDTYCRENTLATVTVTSHPGIHKEPTDTSESSHLSEPVADMENSGTPDCNGDNTETSPCEDKLKTEDVQLHRRKRLKQRVKENENLRRKCQKLKKKEYQKEDIELLQNQLAKENSSSRQLHDFPQQQENLQVLQNQLDEERRQKEEVMQKLASVEVICTEKQDRIHILEAEEINWKKEKKEFEEQERLLRHKLEEMKNAMDQFELNCHGAQGQLAEHAVQLQEKLDENKLVLQDVQGQLADQTKQLQQQLQDNQNITRLYHDLKEAKSEVADQMAQLLQQLNQKNHELQDAQENLQVLQNQFDEEKRQKEEVMQKLTSLEATCTEKQEQQRLHEKQLEDKDKSMKHLEKKFQEIQDQRGNLLQLLEEKKNEVKKLESDCQQTQGQLADQTKQLQQQLDDNQNITRLYHDLKEANSEVADQMAQLLQQLNQKNHDLQEAQENLQVLQNQFDEEKRQKEEVMQKLASVEATCTEKQEQDRLLCHQLEETKNAMDRLELSCHDAQGQLADQTKQLQQQLDDNQNITRLYHDLKEANSEIANQMAQLLEQLNQKNHDLQKTQENLQVLQNQFDEEKRQKEEVMQKLAKVEAICTEKQERIHNLEAEKMKWKIKKKEFEALDDIASVTLEIAQLRENNKQIRNQLNLLETQGKSDEAKIRQGEAGLEGAHSSYKEQEEVLRPRNE